MEKQKVLALFPLANDVRTSLGVWIDIGPNAKRRIDDLMRWTTVTKNRFGQHEKIWIFAAGADKKHEQGKFLAQLGCEYLLRQYDQANTLVNNNKPDIYGTKFEIVWGVTELLRLYSPDQYEVTIVFASQCRHLPRIRQVIERMDLAMVETVFVETGQTKEIPWWREAISRTMLSVGGDGLVYQTFQSLRRRISDRFDQA